VYCALYVGYLVAASSLTALDPIDERLISPLVPALVVLVFVGLGVLAVRARHKRRTWVVWLVFAAGALWVAMLAHDSSDLVRRLDGNGVGGYEAARWQESRLLILLRRQGPSGVLVSNDPYAIRYWTGREARLSPRRHPYRSPASRVDDLGDMRRSLTRGDELYLVWFDGVPRDFLLGLDELVSALRLEPLLQTADGAVYRISEKK